MTDKPVRISIHALGGQGGGILADWIVALAEGQGWTAQATSVPGVAQRTGATLYYLEIVPPRRGRQPILALMPTPGDVDIVIAAELMEAGRAIVRGVVTPNRTTAIVSSHRVFAIAEKSAMGNGILSSADVLEALQTAARRLVIADFAAVAEAGGSFISAALFGALAGSGALPFERSSFERVIGSGSGKGALASRATFSAAADVAQGLAGATKTLTASDVATPRRAKGDLTHLPEDARSLAQLAIERLTDYQDHAYAALYLERLTAIMRADVALGGASEGHRLTLAAARHLGLWMSYEDVIRVADLKTRRARFALLRAEGKVEHDQVSHVTEFLHPRFEEICDTLPAFLGNAMLRSRRARGWLKIVTDRGKFIRTSGFSGFLALWLLGRTRRWRRGTLRYGVEQQRIEAWLESAVNAARRDYALGVEVVRLQRLVKGYGDTHARGIASYDRIMAALQRLAEHPEAAGMVAELQVAALADEDGAALGAALRAVGRRTGLPFEA